MYKRKYDRGTESSFVYSEKYESAREVFFSKSVPILSVGMILWMFSTLAFGQIFGPIFQINFPILIGAVIGYFIGWIATIVLAMKKENTAAMIMFFATTFVTGIVEAPIIMWASSMLGAQMAFRVFLIASVMGVIATIGALFAGRYFGKRISSNLMWGALIGVFIVTITESILIWIVGFDMIIFWTSLIMLSLIFITILYDGAHLKEYIEHSWMLAVVTIFIDFIVMIIRIFIILVYLFRDN